MTCAAPQLDEPSSSEKHLRKWTYRLYPTRAQERSLLATMEAQRRVWNVLLGIVHDTIVASVAPKMKRDEVTAKARELGKSEGDVAKEDGARWRSDVLALFKSKGWTDSVLRELLRARVRQLRESDEAIGAVAYGVLDAVVIFLVRAWSAYRVSVRGAKTPRFKKRGDAVGITAASKNLFWLKKDRFELSMLEDDRGDRHQLRFVKHRELPSVPKSATVVRDGARWFVTFGVELPLENTGPHPGPSVGIDRGVRSMLADSTGRTVRGLADDETFERRKLRLERSAARKQKGSANHRKALARLLKHAQKRTDKRDDVLHKESIYYARAYGTVIVERLAIGNMTKSARGTAEQPGTNVRAKAGLNRSILAQGWGRFVQYLRYKSAQRGGKVVEVEPRDSSRTCAECGTVAVESRDGQRFACVSCGHSGDADVNAARVLLARGLRGELAPAKKPRKKLHTVTGRTHAARTTLSPSETVENAAAGQAVKQPVEDKAIEAPDEAGRTTKSIQRRSSTANLQSSTSARTKRTKAPAKQVRESTSENLGDVAAFGCVGVGGGQR